MLIAVVFVSHLVFCHVNFILSGFSNFAIAEAVLNDTKKSCVMAALHKMVDL